MVTASDLARRVRRRDLVLGTWLTVPHPLVAELMAPCGFDFLLLDGEHGPGHPDTVAGLALAAERHRVPLLYRTRANAPGPIGAALDAGAAGVMVPMVESAAEAAAAVAAAKYPPAGRRGFGPWRASDFYAGAAGYLAEADAATGVVVQVESVAAVAAADRIAAVPGVDALFVGPADLALSMGLRPGAPDADLAAAFRAVAEAARRQGKAAGTDVGSPEEAEPLRALGYTLFTCGADLGYLRAGAAAAHRALREGLGQRP